MQINTAFEDIKNNTVLFSDLTFLSQLAFLTTKLLYLGCKTHKFIFFLTQFPQVKKLILPSSIKSLNVMKCHVKSLAECF